MNKEEFDQIKSFFLRLEGVTHNAGDVKFTESTLQQDILPRIAKIVLYAESLRDQKNKLRADAMATLSELGVYKSALELMAARTETERYPCPGPHTMYSSMSRDELCDKCGSSEDGLGADLTRQVLTREAKEAKVALELGRLSFNLSAVRAEAEESIGSNI